MPHCCDSLQSQEVDIIGRVDGLSDSIDTVGDWYASSKLCVVFNVINTETQWQDMLCVPLEMYLSR